MARRADWDDDDDGFEILCDTSSIEIQQTLETIVDDYIEIIPNDNKSPSLVNTNPIVKKPMKNDNEVNSSPGTNFSRLPFRYGSAAIIPYEEGFDLKSILNSKPILPSNDLMTLLNNNKSQKHSSFNNNFNDLLITHTRDRENLIQTAKQAQQDFINAIHLD